MANFYQKLVNVVLLGFVFVSIGTTTRTVFGGIFFGAGFIFFTYQNSVAIDLNQKLQARSGLALFLLGYYPAYFLLSFFPFISYFFPKLEKFLLTAGVKFLPKKKTEMSLEKFPDAISLVIYVVVEIFVVSVVSIGFFSLFVSTICSINSIPELLFLLSTKEAILSLVQASALLFSRKIVKEEYDQFFLKYASKHLDQKVLEDEELISSYSKGYEILSYVGPYMVVIGIFAKNFTDFMRVHDLSQMNLPKISFPKKGLFASINPTGASGGTGESSPGNLVSKGSSINWPENRPPTSSSPPSQDPTIIFTQAKTYPPGKYTKPWWKTLKPSNLTKWSNPGLPDANSRTLENFSEKISTTFLIVENLPVILPIQYDWGQPVAFPPGKDVKPGFIISLAAIRKKIEEDLFLPALRRTLSLKELAAKWWENFKSNAQKAGILSPKDPGAHVQTSLDTSQEQGITDAGKKTENVENPLTVAPANPGFDTVSKEKVLPPGVDPVPITQVAGARLVSASPPPKPVSRQRSGKKTQQGVNPPPSPSGIGGSGLVVNLPRRTSQKMEANYREMASSSVKQAPLFFETPLTGNTEKLAQTVYKNRLCVDKIKAKKQEAAAKATNQSSTSPQNSSATGPVGVLKYQKEFKLIHIVRGTIPTKEAIAELVLVLEPLLQMLSLLALGKLSEEQCLAGTKTINEEDVKKYIADVLGPALIKLREEKGIEAYPLFMNLMYISLLKVELLKVALLHEHLTAIAQNAVNLKNLTDAEQQQITAVTNYLNKKRWNTLNAKIKEIVNLSNESELAEARRALGWRTDKARQNQRERPCDPNNLRLFRTFKMLNSYKEKYESIAATLIDDVPVEALKFGVLIYYTTDANLTPVIFILPVEAAHIWGASGRSNDRNKPAGQQGSSFVANLLDLSNLNHAIATALEASYYDVDLSSSAEQQEIDANKAQDPLSGLPGILGRYLKEIESNFLNNPATNIEIFLSYDPPDLSAPADPPAPADSFEKV